MERELTRSQINRWRRYLANERAEAAVYRELARKRTGSEREILMRLAEAESRHEMYWRQRLGEFEGMPRQPDLGTRVLGFMARHFGSVFVLALMQTAETRTPYVDDDDAPDAIAADERLHAEVVRGLAASGRERMSGGFRAAVFGANDGLVSNLALVLGVLGTGMSSQAVLLTGISGLLAGALSMAAGEYVSVRSQGELIDASTPHPSAHRLLESVDVNANELALVYRARGMNAQEADERAAEAFATYEREGSAQEVMDHGESAEPTGGAVEAAVSSFGAFAVGAFIPVIPFLLGASPTVGAVIALVMVAVALMCTGSITGLLSGRAPLPRALRQLVIGLGAAGVTYALGTLFGAIVA
ncbi:VIT1/CCC1 transporter family protein [Corynebacterium tapiri]|uniref:Rubrerythrin family protein n=1 Tax=Corynebacterium tapiri TaxID=1448266 RepID=A0A5C4U2Q6_9CORY|nr:VIT1/CCC1 transporter family protein [Corynebacterium tapiri]TNL96681.1 rubrerythrin family protein [Corynebacterium tapiri]